VKIFAKISFLLFCIFISGEAYAACSVSTTNINFGTYDVFSITPKDSTGTITVTCGPPPPPHITISIGPSPNSGVFIPRKMRSLSGSDYLNYNLFSNASMSSVWGDGTGGTSVVETKTTPGQPGFATIYGRIPAGQDVSAGTYSETLTVTVLW
jgi:spore coat protein U-like protein